MDGIRRAVNIARHRGAARPSAPRSLGTRPYTIITRGTAGHPRCRLDSEVAMGEPAKAGRDQAGRAPGPVRRPGQLPSGRHGLLRSFVAANQRERILSAVIIRLKPRAGQYAQGSPADLRGNRVQLSWREWLALPGTG